MGRGRVNKGGRGTGVKMLENKFLVPLPELPEFFGALQDNGVGALSFVDLLLFTGCSLMLQAEKEIN